MSVITPQSNIKILQVPIGINNANQITFSSKQTQYNYFNSLPKKVLENATYVRENGEICFNANYDEVINYNYVMYQNEGYSDKWFYAFITNVRYISNGSVGISIQTDYYQTWQFDITFKPSFVEREHVNNDTIGLHTIPENVETGDYICNEHIVDSNNANLCVVMGTTITIGELINAGANVYNGIPSGVMYYGFTDINSSSANSLSSVLRMLAENGKSEGVNSLFIAPTWLTGGTGLINSSTSVATYDLGLSRMSQLNGYTPKNKKLLTHPFCYFIVSNAVGSTNVLKQEVWSLNNDNEMVLKVVGCLTPGCSIKAIPINYNGAGRNDDEAISLGKFPMLNWINDQYTNWLTQNGVNIGLSVGASGLQLAGGLLAMGTGLGSGIGATSVLNGALGIAQSLGQVYQHSLTPPSVEGNVNSGDVTTASGATRFHIYKMSVKQEYAKVIDGYFSMYGYKVNEVKVPNLTGRRNWNYVKTIGANIIGNIPQMHLQEIKNMFDSGITLWHTTSNFLDYSANNDII